MDHERMIMGEPPDLEVKSNRWLYIFLVLIIFTSVVCIIFWGVKTKKPNNLIASKTSSPVIGIIPIKKNRLDNNQKVELNKLSEKADSFKPNDAAQKETEGQLSQNKVKYQNISANETVVAQTKKTDPSKVELEQNIVEIKTESTIEQFKKIQVHDNKSVLPSSKTSAFSAMLDFEFKSSNITSAALDRLKNIFDQLKGKKGRLILEGHTCSIGSDASNIDLSEKRVKNVANTLRELGLDMNIRMYKLYYGESRPISTNETPEGKARNRRVKIRFVPNY